MGGRAFSGQERKATKTWMNPLPFVREIYLLRSKFLLLIPNRQFRHSVVESWVLNVQWTWRTTLLRRHVNAHFRAQIVSFLLDHRLTPVAPFLKPNSWKYFGMPWTISAFRIPEAISSSAFCKNIFLHRLNYTVGRTSLGHGDGWCCWAQSDRKELEKRSCRTIEFHSEHRLLISSTKICCLADRYVFDTVRGSGAACVRDRPTTRTRLRNCCHLPKWSIFSTHSRLCNRINVASFEPDLREGISSEQHRRTSWHFTKCLQTVWEVSVCPAARLRNFSRISQTFCVWRYLPILGLFLDLCGIFFELIVHAVVLLTAQCSGWLSLLRAYTEAAEKIQRTADQNNRYDHTPRMKARSQKQCKCTWCCKQETAHKMSKRLW